MPWAGMDLKDHLVQINKCCITTDYLETCGSLNILLSILYCILYLLLLLLTSNRKYTNQELFIYHLYINKQLHARFDFNHTWHFSCNVSPRNGKNPVSCPCTQTDCYWKDKDSWIIIRPSFFAQSLRSKPSYEKTSFIAENILS